MQVVRNYGTSYSLHHSFLWDFVDLIVRGVVCIKRNGFLKKKKLSSNISFFFSDDERGTPRRSFVTDVDVAGSRAWYNTVKMAVFTSFVTAATVRDDEIHKQPPIVDLHIQMVFFFFYFYDASIATPRAIFRHDKHVARRAISYNNNTTYIHTQTCTNANYLRFSARENHASFREAKRLWLLRTLNSVKSPVVCNRYQQYKTPVYAVKRNSRARACGQISRLFRLFSRPTISSRRSIRCKIA